MAKYDYSVREVLRDTRSLEEELQDLGRSGWEVVSILEKPFSGALVKQPRWLIVSKTVVS